MDGTSCYITYERRFQQTLRNHPSRPLHRSTRLEIRSSHDIPQTSHKPASQPKVEYRHTSRMRPRPTLLHTKTKPNMPRFIHIQRTTDDILLPRNGIILRHHQYTNTWDRDGHGSIRTKLYSSFSVSRRSHGHLPNSCKPT